jgi:hypothetical protein
METDTGFIATPKLNHIKSIGVLIEKAEQHLRTEIEKYQLFNIIKVIYLAWGCIK